MNRYLVITGLTAICLAAAEQPASEKDPPSNRAVEVTKTESVPFPAGGVLHLRHSIGDLNIEAWDNPNVEITTIKSTADLYAESDVAAVKAEMEKVTLVTERHGDEVVITTGFPRRLNFGIPDYPPLGRAAKFNLEYHISVPRSARLVIDHIEGAVNVDRVAGDIQVHVKQGEIMLHLPEDAKYSIDAKATYGNVNSDFPGERHRRWFGQRAFAAESGPAHKLSLRVGYGDIVLLTVHTPKYPDAPGKSARSGQ